MTTTTINLNLAGKEITTDVLRDNGVCHESCLDGYVELWSYEGRTFTVFDNVVTEGDTDFYEFKSQ